MEQSNKLFRNIRKSIRLPVERMLMIQEIEKAKSDWISAQLKLDHVIEHDQIDYAIYSLEAAEKRYEMLIRQAKRMKLHLLEDHQMTEEKE
jgi:hypothetical protein